MRAILVSLVIATSPYRAVIALIDELLPGAPALRAVATPIPQLGAIDEQRPAWAGMQFNAMGNLGEPEFPCARLAYCRVVNAAGCNPPLGILAFEDDGDIPGWMVVQRAIVVAVQELV